MKKAILFGASGFIGSYLLKELLERTDYEKITIVVRKKLPINHPKLVMLIGDYNSLPILKNDIEADDVFIAIGTTKKNTPDEKIYYQIDHDYPVLAAKIAKEKGANAVYVVSSEGANADSKVFYIKTKGELERDITALNFEHTYFFRPSMLMGNRTNEKRTMEKALMNIFSVINPLLIGNINKYRGILGKDVAKAMNNFSKKPSQKLAVHHWRDMMQMI